MHHVATTHQGTFLAEGKSTDVFDLSDGHQVNEVAYYGHLVLRLMGCLVLFYTSRVMCKGRLTMEEIIFSLKHYWRFIDCKTLELTTLSQGVDEKAA
jgi:hypothetical protein